MRGFENASNLLSERIRKAGEKRGFAVSRLLTRWSEVVGEDLAARARPAQISYGKDGVGATLTLLVRSADAPVVQMEIPRIKDRVNACYGYAAVSRIRLTQTAPTGFAEGRTPFAPAPAAPPPPAPETCARAAALSEGVHDDGLRAALEALGRNILTRTGK